MTSSNGNIFCVTGALCGEFTGRRWIPPTKASNAELWCFLWSAPWINGWVNNREAGDLRRHRAHHDVTLMRKWISYVVCKKVIILFRAQYVNFSRLETAISVFQMGSNNRVFFTSSGSMLRREQLYGNVRKLYSACSIELFYFRGSMLW